MSCRRESLLMNNTRVPAGTVSSFGLTPLDVSVKVYGLDGFGVGAGVELPPPHDAASRQTRIARKTTPCHYPGARRQSQGAHTGPPRSAALLDDDAPLESGAVGIVVIVKAADSPGRKAERGF